VLLPRRTNQAAAAHLPVRSLWQWALRDCADHPGDAVRNIAFAVDVVVNRGPEGMRDTVLVLSQYLAHGAPHLAARDSGGDEGAALAFRMIGAWAATGGPEAASMLWSEYDGDSSGDQDAALFILLMHAVRAAGLTQGEADQAYRLIRESV
jgi:hypothetical protein